jgi:hypothetical protein
MNGAYKYDKSVEGRFSAVIEDLTVKIKERHDETGQGPTRPYKSDIQEAIRPFIKVWELEIRIDEARISHSLLLTERVKELARLKAEAEKEIPKEFRL